MTSVPVRIDSGTRVGEYVVEAELAHEGPSLLYVARDAGGDRVVLKVVPPDAAMGPARTRLMSDARGLAAIDHPGVVRVHGSGEHDGMLWIATRHVRGVDLRLLLAERGSLPVDVALRYTIEAAEALRAAHGGGVIHRNLKPANLMFASDARIVLVGFGVSLPTQGPRAGETRTSALDAPSTSFYFAPEQLEYGLADERSDVWALGCILYEMVVGEPPFGRALPATLAAIMRHEPVFPPRLASSVVHIVDACLRKSAFARVASAGAMLALLRDALREEKSQAFLLVEPASRRSSPASTVQPSSSRIVSAERISGVPRASIAPGRAPTAAPKRSSGTMRVAQQRGRVKGTAVRAGIAWFSETYGEQALARVFVLASPELQAALQCRDAVFGLIASGWYDTQLVGELLALVERVAAPSDRAAFDARVAEAVARDNVFGVHRSLFRLVGSPARLEANAQRVWSTYVDEGTLSVRLGPLGSFDARVRGWSRHHSNVCRLLGAVFASSLRLVGYTGLALEGRQCVARGDGQCTFEGAWVA